MDEWGNATDARKLAGPLEHRVRAECDLVEAISACSQERFSEGIVAAHTAHAGEYAGLTSDGRKKSDDQRVVRAIGLSVLVRVGRTQGLDYEPRSPYVHDLSELIAQMAPIAPEYESEWESAG